MLHCARDFVSPGDDLVSGGAAVSDHLAVLLFLDGAARSLTLYLPEHFDLESRRFLERGQRSCGAISNYYHRRFSERLHQSLTDERLEPETGRNQSNMSAYNSLCHIRIAADFGARLVVVPGFFQRNIPVGRVDRLVAFTFGSGDAPADGGTAHTWRHSTATEKIHVSIGGL